MFDYLFMYIVTQPRFCLYGFNIFMFHTSQFFSDKATQSLLTNIKGLNILVT